MRSQNFTMRNIILIAVCVLSVAGCAILERSALFEPKLTGVWTYRDFPENPLTLTFKEKGIYELDTNGDGQRDIWGVYRYSPSMIFFKDVGGSFDEDCGADGVYEYKVGSIQMDFAILGDQCPYRAEALAQIWKRRIIEE